MSWEKVLLGNISSSIQTGPFGSQLHQSDYSDTGTPVVMPKDIINGHVLDTSIARIDEIHVERLKRHKLCEGDIVYARRGDVGKCAYITNAEVGWLCGTGCLKVSLNLNDVYPKFVFYQLQLPATIGWVEKHAVGATMLNINTSILSAVPISLPEYKVQQRIASILSAYDDLIENNQKQIKLLEEAAQRLYKEWFVDLRFPGYENVKVVDGVPEGWIVKKISDVCVKINAGGTPRRSVKSYWENGTVDWFRTQELCDNWLTSSEIKITNDALENSSAKLFPKNSVLMAIYASPTLGRLGILDKEACSNQAALCLLADETQISYLWLFFKLKELREYFNSIARGAGQQNISGDVVKTKLITIPGNDIMNQFRDIFIPLYLAIKKLQYKNGLLTESRERMLAKLMTGEIEV